MLHLLRIDNLKISLFAALALMAPLTSGVEAAPWRTISLGGYYKNLFTASESFNGASFTSDLNRLRLDFDVKVTEALDIKVIYDNEAILGSVLDTVEFRTLRGTEPDTFFDLDTTSLDREDIFWRQSLYRAYLTFSRGALTLRAGRQRVALGTGRLWNPEDLLNPVSPLALERDERTGVDAVSMELAIGPVAGLNLTYAPGRAWNREVLFARAGGNLSGYDLSVLFGSFRADKVLGVDFSGYIGSSGFRGESTYTFSDKGPDFLRLVLSFDHTLPSGLYLLVEYLYNGGKRGGALSTIELASFTEEMVTRNENLLGLLMGYDVTPLVRLDVLTVVDLDDASLFLGPSIGYNVMENMDLSAGVQLFSGREGSEYGDLEDVYIAELKWYF